MQFKIEDALADIDLLTELNAPEHQGPVVSFYDAPFDESSPVTKRMKIFVDRPLLLSRILPVLQDLGLDVVDERPFELSPDGLGERYIYDMGLQVDPDVDFSAIEGKVADAYSAVVARQLNRTS